MRKTERVKDRESRKVERGERQIEQKGRERRKTERVKRQRVERQRKEKGRERRKAEKGERQREEKDQREQKRKLERGEKECRQREGKYRGEIEQRDKNGRGGMRECYSILYSVYVREVRKQTKQLERHSDRKKGQYTENKKVIFLRYKEKNPDNIYSKRY